MIKLFVCDLDNTLLMHTESGSYIKEVDAEALKKAKESGIRIMIASGRHHLFVTDWLEKYGLKADIVGNNGSSALVDGKLVVSHLIDRKGLSLLLEHVAAFHSDVYIKANTQDNTEYAFPKKAEDETSDYMTSIPLTTYLESGEGAFNRFVVILPTTDRLIACKSDLEQRFSDYFEFNQSTPNLMEVTPKGIDKGHTVQEVIEGIYRFDRKETAGIGDSYNDISMLQQVGVKFAVSWSSEEVQSHADYVVSGVKEAIDTILEKNTTD